VIAGGGGNRAPHVLNGGVCFALHHCSWFYSSLKERICLFPAAWGCCVGLDDGFSSQGNILAYILSWGHRQGSRAAAWAAAWAAAAAALGKQQQGSNKAAISIISSSSPSPLLEACRGPLRGRLSTLPPGCWGLGRRQCLLRPVNTPPSQAWRS